MDFSKGVRSLGSYGTAGSTQSMPGGSGLLLSAALLGLATTRRRHSA